MAICIIPIQPRAIAAIQLRTPNLQPTPLSNLAMAGAFIATMERGPPSGVFDSFK